MVVAPSGKPINIRACRRCLKCGTSTGHVCYGIRYEKPDRASESYLKHMFWACERCGESSEELEEVPEPTERLMLTKRLLQVGEDYDVRGVSIQSNGNRVVLTVEFRDYDPARLRRLACKMEEQGFINVAELMELHQAGAQPGRTGKAASETYAVQAKGERSQSSLQLKHRMVKDRQLSLSM